jgi:hypothetical protein
MSKAMLPYALSLNPGLPTPMHHTMIRQEIERRQQQESPTSSVTNAATDQTLTVNSQQTNIISNTPTNMNDKLVDPTNDHINLVTD